MAYTNDLEIGEKNVKFRDNAISNDVSFSVKLKRNINFILNPW